MSVPSSSCAAIKAAVVGTMAGLGPIFGVALGTIAISWWRADFEWPWQALPGPPLWLAVIGPVVVNACLGAVMGQRRFPIWLTLVFPWPMAIASSWMMGKIWFPGRDFISTVITAFAIMPPLLAGFTARIWLADDRPPFFRRPGFSLSDLFLVPITTGLMFGVCLMGIKVGPREYYLGKSQRYWTRLAEDSDPARHQKGVEGLCQFMATAKRVRDDVIWGLAYHANDPEAAIRCLKIIVSEPPGKLRRSDLETFCESVAPSSALEPRAGYDRLYALLGARDTESQSALAQISELLSGGYNRSAAAILDRVLKHSPVVAIRVGIINSWAAADPSIYYVIGDTLRPLTRDPNPEVARAARAALGRLEPKSTASHTPR
jgi:hypothetical protein